MKKKISVSLAAAIAIIAMTVTFSVTMILAMKMFDRTVSDVNEKQAMYNKLAEVDQVVRDNFYTEINDDTLYDMLATGYIAGLGDRNSRYYTAKQVIERNDIASGKLMGIGVELTKDTSGYFKVVKLYTGSPAETAGLVKGTILTKVGETDLKSLTLDTVTGMLRGESGTSVTVTYLKDNVETAVEIQRSPFDLPLVEYQLTEDNVGYLKILSFSEDTAARLDYAINAMTDQGATSLIFDLRDNADGDLAAAADCIDLLCPAGTIVSGTYRDGETRVLYTSDEKEVALPMVALTNESTSGAAELFAVSIRDFGKGKIVGAT
ncbi:MAG TPA: PDZ domain-containing protein, partial [Candidatus Pygmaiobacter gallistercoris]|nr:PDZ domain-containing protein [Candidatus Pygmaiobacter gallistercoris]